MLQTSFGILVAEVDVLHKRFNAVVQRTKLMILEFDRVGSISEVCAACWASKLIFSEIWYQSRNNMLQGVLCCKKHLQRENF
jgi:hypothetical protein